MLRSLMLQVCGFADERRSGNRFGSHTDSVLLTLERVSPQERLRIWSGCDGPVDVGGSLVVEWAGRVGHPTSYALLGGRLPAALAPEAIAVPDERGQFKDSIAGRADQVAWGLPDEYADALALGVRVQMTITYAAHGARGSSVQAFQFVSGMLHRLLVGDVHLSDDKLWHLWDERKRIAESAS